jgi:hypothetical protein
MLGKNGVCQVFCVNDLDFVVGFGVVAPLRGARWPCASSSTPSDLPICNRSRSGRDRFDLCELQEQLLNLLLFVGGTVRSWHVHILPWPECPLIPVFTVIPDSSPAQNSFGTIQTLNSTRNRLSVPRNDQAAFSTSRLIIEPCSIPIDCGTCTTWFREFWMPLWAPGLFHFLELLRSFSQARNSRYPGPTP